MANVRVHAGSIVLLGICALLPAPAHAVAAAWTPIPPGGSSVRVLAAVPGSATVFAGTAYGGVFRSFDRGATWSPANDGLEGVDVKVLVAAPAGSATLYAGTESGLFQSDDAGGSWHATSLRPIGTALAAPAQALAIAPSAPATRYAAVSGTVYRSDDGGGAWTPLAALPDLSIPSALAVDAGSPLHVYVGCADPGSILISRTGGRSWRVVSLPGAERVLGLAADPARPGSVYAATGGGVFVTRNGGGQWSLVAGLPAGSYTAVGLAIDAPGTVYAATDRARGRLWKSTDSGATWKLVLAGSPFSAIVGDPLRPQRVYVAATPDGVSHGPLAGGGWSQQQSGLDASSVATLAIDPRRPGLLYVQALLDPQSDLTPGLPTSTVRVSADGGGTWRVIGGLPALQGLFVDPAMAGGAFALAKPAFVAPGVLPGAASTQLWHTADGGATWQPQGALNGVALDVAAAPTAPGTLFAAAYAVDPRLLPCPIGCSAIVGISTDGGATWSLNGSAPVQIDGSTGWFVRIDPADAHTVYLGESGHLMKTVDGGASWSVLDAAEMILDLVIDPVQPQRLYAVPFDGTLAGSTDGGQTWQNLGTGLPAGGVRTLAIGAAAATPILYAATAAGVFISPDRGATWAPLGAGLPAPSVLALAVDPVSGAVYAGVEGAGGLFKLTP